MSKPCYNPTCRDGLVELWGRPATRCPRCRGSGDEPKKVSQADPIGSGQLDAQIWVMMKLERAIQERLGSLGRSVVSRLRQRYQNLEEIGAALSWGHYRKLFDDGLFEPDAPDPDIPELSIESLLANESEQLEKNTPKVSRQKVIENRIKQVIRLRKQGLNNREISKEMGVCDKTISSVIKAARHRGYEVPTPKRKRTGRMSMTERREKVRELLSLGETPFGIAAALRISLSAIYRDMKAIEAENGEGHGDAGNESS